MQDGRLLFARYAFMPNRLGYCGGDENEALFQYCLGNQSDAGLVALIREFQAAYPYLQFIAHANGIADPTDPRVVEAYWVGNDLLERVDMVAYHRFLEERLGKRISAKAFKYLVGKVPEGARPHHSFHVLEVCTRLGTLEQDLETLDRCRIAWGRVTSLEGDYLKVSYRPLALRDGRLALGERRERRVQYSIDGRGYLQDVQPGELVAIHWDWACDRLTPRQTVDLEVETVRHLELASRTL